MEGRLPDLILNLQDEYTIVLRLLQNAQHQPNHHSISYNRFQLQKYTHYTKNFSNILLYIHCCYLLICISIIWQLHPLHWKNPSLVPFPSHCKRVFLMHPPDQFPLFHWPLFLGSNPCIQVHIGECKILQSPKFPHLLHNSHSLEGYENDTFHSLIMLFQMNCSTIPSHCILNLVIRELFTIVFIPFGS